MYYCGLDLGKKSSHFCILDAKRHIVERGQVRNRIADLAKYFGDLPKMRIVVEASTKAFWTADRLEELGHDVVVVDPGKTKAIGAARIKHDKLDAKILAELCAADLLPRVDRQTEQERLDRLVVVSRDALVKSRTNLMNMVRSVLDSEGIGLKSSSADAFACAVSEIWETLPNSMCSAIEPAVKSIQMLCEQIDDCDRRLKEVMADDEEAKRLMTIPGVGIIVASCFLMAIRDPGRFKSGRQAGAYLGLVPSLYQSGNTLRLGRITKRGNRQARWALCVAANSLMRSRQPSALRDWGRALAKRVGRKKAVVALARKLASVMWAMLKNQADFESRLPEAA